MIEEKFSLGYVEVSWHDTGLAYFFLLVITSIFLSFEVMVLGISQVIVIMRFWWKKSAFIIKWSLIWSQNLIRKTETVSPILNDPGELGVRQRMLTQLKNSLQKTTAMLARLEERGKELRQLSQERGRVVQPSFKHRKGRRHWTQVPARWEKGWNTRTSLPPLCGLLLMPLFGQMTGSLPEPEPLYQWE